MQSKKSSLEQSGDSNDRSSGEKKFSVPSLLKEKRSSSQRIQISKSGVLQRKGTFSKWKRYHFMLENGLLMEFKRENLQKPIEVIRLEDAKIQEGKTLTGENNTIAVIIPKKNTIFLRTATNSLMIEWLSALSTHTSNDIVFDSSLADAFNDPVVVVSSTGIIVEVNETLAEIFGYTKNDMIGRNIKIIIPPEIAKIHDDYFKNYDPNKESNIVGKPRNVEALHANGTLFPILLSLGVDNSKPEEIRFIGTIRSDKSNSMNVESISNFISQEVDKIMDKASVTLKDTIENQLKDLINELEDYKSKCKKLITSESHRVINFLSNNKDEKEVAITKFDINIDTSKVEIQEKLGVGGSGMVVYSALVDGWKCAVKELDLTNAKEKEVELFESEVSVLEKLPYHKNIVRILFHTRSNNVMRLFVSRYRETLAQKLSSLNNQKKYLTFEKIIKLSLDIVKGLMFLHEREIIHRDIKSDNIFVNYNSSSEISYLSIGDFDRAKIVSGNSQAKTIVGTVCWLAPEVLNSGNVREYTFSADVWSLGMVMFELMTNMKPYFEENQMDVMKLISMGKHPSFPKDFSDKNVRPLIPLWEKCLDPNPSTRITLVELKEQLLHLL
eukprot:TRINITY_DN4871_c0_g1_i1.p1 TRINITY_DN4871_c0_g1~~TRINITY_DN4871_c0_g1_i1.p1  ORF type:complete len:612 (+),score=172.96 TRINITY_DN4871_c0_g1_i1:345-2180(+)